MEQEPNTENISTNQRIRQVGWILFASIITFLLGMGSGYLTWGRDTASKPEKELAQLYEQVNPVDGYTLPVSYGDFGPQLVAAGVVDLKAFQDVMAASGDPLSDLQLEILNKGSEEQIVISAENAHFLLNYFWAIGLANKNLVLTRGPIARNGRNQIDRFASTGGWSLATRPIPELYASLDLIRLTAEQQARVEEVAAAVYRPCCDNATLFPDCNHGMAMLGLLELMASRGATVDQMFEAAKYVNAYWFPQQNVETALYLHTAEGIDFSAADPRRVVGKELASASGAGKVHQTLQAQGLLKQATDQGGGCTN